MSGRVVASCIFYALLGACIGTVITAWLHMLTLREPPLATFLKPLWYPGEPQAMGVALIYGAAGAVFRYIQIKVFGQWMRGWALLESDETNTGYKPAMIAGALFAIAPLLIYKFLIVDTQLDAADRYHGSTFISFTELAGKYLFKAYFGDALSSWPTDFYLATVIAAALGALAGFTVRADQRNEHFAFVLPAGAVMAAALGFVISFVAVAVYMTAVGTPPQWVAPVAKYVWPIVCGVSYIFNRIDPKQREKKLDKLYQPHASFTEQIAKLVFALQAGEQLFWSAISTVIVAVFYIGGVWAFVLISHEHQPIEPGWLWFASLTSLWAVYIIVRAIAEQYLALAPRRAPPLDPAERPAGSRRPARDNDKGWG